MDFHPQTSPLAHIPAEILIQITRRLTTTDLLSFRSTCKDIEATLLHFFAHEFFRKRQFMLAYESLEALIGISKNPRLAPALRQVIIGLDEFPDFPSQGENVLRHRQLVAQQLNLLHTGRAVQMLAEAFENLPHLVSVDIRDFNSPTRFRDGPRAVWHSYGAMPTGAAPKPSFHAVPSRNMASVAFIIVLEALAKSGAHPANLEVLIRNRQYGLTETVFDLSLPESNAVIDVVSGLRKLHVDVRLFPVTTVHSDGNHVVPAATPISGFLAHAHNLAWLRTNFQNANFVESDTLPSLFCLRTPSPSPSPSPSLLPSSRRPMSASGAGSATTLLPYLRKLDLGFFHAPPAALVAVFTQFRHISECNLWKVTLMTDHGFVAQENMWLEVLTGIAQADTATRYAIDMCGQRHPRGLVPVEYQGSQKFVLFGQKIRDDLDSVTSNMKLLLPEPVPQNDDDDDENDDDDDGIEEEIEDEIMAEDNGNDDNGNGNGNGTQTNDNETAS